VERSKLKEDRDSILRKIIKQMRREVPSAEEEMAGMSLEDPEVMEQRKNPPKDLELDPVEPVPMSDNGEPEEDEDELDIPVTVPIMGKRRPRTKIV
jgi:hypothetical protein